MSDTSTIRLERTLGRVLSTGIRASSTCLAAGLVLSMWPLTNAIAGLLLHSGLIILLATPAARVLFSAVEYINERDWTFVALTTIVLLELAGGVIAAFR